MVVILYYAVGSIHWFGVVVQDNMPVLYHLGPSLEDLFVYCGRKFSLKIVLMLPDQMVYVVDFGLAKRYRDPGTSSHIPYKYDLAGIHSWTDISKVTLLDFVILNNVIPIAASGDRDMSDPIPNQWFSVRKPQLRDEDELAAAKAITKATRASDEDGLAAAKAGGGCAPVCGERERVRG
ncbi:hypothetical protein L1987_60006 [Smallanthus sonchifolius]|uniref:Uncharacterized protein n=1 Tax=Smallanthus sonchifolius TaxID=185202 RepID=A0ACB9D777_9ASTR|nr:hypothetical protein L1987_60006 [Smallanthus sonchifolius]